MRKWQSVALAIGLFFLMASGVLAEKPPVAISTSGRFIGVLMGHSANVRLMVRMERHERNWELVVGCEGIDGGVLVSSGRSFWNGEKQAEVYDIGFSLTPATYNCEAVLKRKQENGKFKEFTSNVEVTIH